MIRERTSFVLPRHVTKEKQTTIIKTKTINVIYFFIRKVVDQLTYNHCLSFLSDREENSRDLKGRELGEGMVKESGGWLCR